MRSPLVRVVEPYVWKTLTPFDRLASLQFVHEIVDRFIGIRNRLANAAASHGCAIAMMACRPATSQCIAASIKSTLTPLLACRPSGRGEMAF
jgi:hypothetical protein